MNTFNKITVDRLYDEIDNAATKAAPLFQLYGWTYGEDHVPTHSELVNCITELAEHALKSFYQSDKEYRGAEVGSGRFAVKVREFEDEVNVRIVLELDDKSWYKAEPNYR